MKASAGFFSKSHLKTTSLPMMKFCCAAALSTGTVQAESKVRKSEVAALEGSTQEDSTAAT